MAKRFIAMVHRKGAKNAKEYLKEWKKKINFQLVPKPCPHGHENRLGTQWYRNSVSRRERNL